MIPGLWSVFRALLSFCLAVESHSSCSCYDRVETICVALGDKVPVPCPDPRAKEVNFRLYKGCEPVDNYTFKEARGAEGGDVGGRAQMRWDPDGRRPYFVTARVTAESSGIYSCQANTILPPPLMTTHNASRVLVLVEGHQCNYSTCDCHAPPDAGNVAPLWLWIVGLVAVSAYGVMATVAAFVNWLRVRRAENSQNEYMNAPPVAPKCARKS